MVIESYIGIDNEEILENLIKPLKPKKIIFSDDLAFDEKKIIEMTDRDLIPEDRVFGILTHYEVKDFFDPKVLEDTRKEVENADGLIVIYGTGASLITTGDILIYADLARWEAQLRYRAGATNWKINNPDEDILKKYKRGYFLEWRISDKLKDQLHNSIDYLLDTNRKNEERTGLHELEFIETRRHWFDSQITLQTKGSVNMLNLVEGEEAIVESIDGSFEPYEIHYGETFIIPAQIKEYKIIPKTNNDQKLAIMQAYVR